MKLKVELIYKTMLLLLLFLPAVISSTEVNIIIGLLFFEVVTIGAYNKFSTTLVNTIFPLVLILIIACISSFFYPSTIYDNIRGFAYIVKPILFIILGYILISKIKNKEFIFKAIIYLAVFFAILHLIDLCFFLLDNPFNINSIRFKLKKSNAIELLAIVFLFVNKKDKYFILPLKYLGLIKFILYSSFILYFSRTMLVAVFILIFAINGYAKITRKGIKYILLFFALIILFYTILYNMDIPRESTGFKNFLYKIKLAPSEIFSTAKIDINDHKNLWDHWRAYEALKAVEQLIKTQYMVGIIFGKGLGSLIDLGFVAPLNSEGIQFIPKIHNGYINIMFKSGILGLICYCMFIIYLYFQAYKKAFNKGVLFVNNMISGIGIYFLFTTLIITGIYNQGDIMSVILGAFLSLKYYYNQNKVNENSNIRN